MFLASITLHNLRGKKLSCPCYHVRHLQQIDWNQVFCTCFFLIRYSLILCKFKCDLMKTFLNCDKAIVASTLTLESVIMRWKSFDIDPNVAAPIALFFSFLVHLSYPCQLRSRRISSWWLRKSKKKKVAEQILIFPANYNQIKYKSSNCKGCGILKSVNRIVYHL